MQKEKTFFTNRSSIHAPQPSCTPFSPRTHRRDPNFSPSERAISIVAEWLSSGSQKNSRWRLVQDPRDASLSPRTGRDGRQQVANSRQPPKIHLWDPGHQKHLQPFAFPPRWGDVNQGVSVSLAQSFLLLQRQFPV